MLGMRVGVWEINRAPAMAFGKFGRGLQYQRRAAKLHKTPLT
jgi:hypothetical protein